MINVENSNKPEYLSSEFPVTMMPFIPLEDLLTVLEFFLVVIRYVRLKRLQNYIHDDVDTLGVLTVINAYFSRFIEIFQSDNALCKTA